MSKGDEKSDRGPFLEKQPKKTLPIPGWGGRKGFQSSPSLLPNANHCYRGEAKLLPGCLGEAFPSLPPLPQGLS